MKTLNKKQAEKLFDDYSVYINGIEVIPVVNAEALFGVDCLNRINYDDESTYALFYGTYAIDRRISMDYFTYDGFMRLVTYNNVMKCFKQEGASE